MRNNHPKLDASLDRLFRFREELKYCDSATRFQLLGSWKELILRNLGELLDATNDVDAISKIDRAIALSQDIASLEL